MGYGLAKTDRSAAGVVEYPLERRNRSTGEDFVPTVEWIGSIADASGGLRSLRQPLRIDVSRDPDDGNFIAFCPFAASGGVGRTPQGALDDLGVEILRLRDELEGSNDDELAEDAIDLKHRLRRALP